MTLLDQDKPVVVSDQIAEPVRRVAERSWALRVSMGMLQAGTLALAVGLGAILAMGMLPGLPITLRIILAVGSWGIGVWGLVHWALPAFKRLPFFSAARAIDEAHPETFESISSAIELSAEKDTRFRGSPELINHLIKQAEQDAASIDPSHVISGKSVLRWIGLALVVVSMYFIAMVSVPRAFKEGLRGMATPWVPGQTHIPVELKIDPGENITIAQGESLDINVTVNDPARPDLSVDRAIMTITYANGPAQAVEMERADARTFRTRLSAIQQNLSYTISALGEDSPVYKVNVVPRPGVASMSVVYTYPAYTRMAPKTDASPANGTLEAIVGTVARVTLRTTQPVESDKCYLAIAQGQNLIQLQASDATTLTGEVTISTSSSYVVNLISKIDGRELKSDTSRVRQIIAKPDEAPRVTIQSPGATARVRPDDAAPIRFTAEDDFGITTAEMVVQVDNRTPETLPVALAGSGTQADQTYNLPIRDVIAHASIRDPKRITYFVRVMDNAQPKANVGTSSKQILEIDRNADRLSLREDMAAAQATAEALRTAEQKLTSAAKKLADLDKISAERQLSGGERQRLTEARQEMSEATQAMEKAMEMAPKTLEKQREELRQINDKMVRPGTESAARAELSDDGKRRQENISDASAQASKARDELSAMRQKVDKSVEDERLKKSLADAAQRQQQLARDMENGGRPGELQNRQESLKKDVEQMIRENENLRDAAKKQAEPKVKSLADKIDEIARRQEKTNQTISDAAETAQINEKLKKIIAEQEKLNADIARLDRQAGVSARAAQAPIPDETKTGNIVASLKAQQLQGAQAQMRVVANELDRTASRGGAGGDEQLPAVDADTIKQDVDKLSQDIQDAKTAGRAIDRPSDVVNQKAQEIAVTINKVSTRPVYSNDQRRMQQDARNFAQQASNAARAGKAEEAQQKLSQAVQELQRITPKISPQAAKQAHALADRQRQLADDTAKLNTASREADQRRDEMKRSEAEQKQIANDIDSAEKEARELAKEMQPTNPESADQAKRAAESLKRAAADQRKAAESSKDLDMQTASRTSQRAQNEVQQAKGELRPEEAKNAAQNQQQNQQEQNAQAQQNKAQQQNAQNNQNGEQKQADAQAQKQAGENGEQKQDANQAGQQANAQQNGQQNQQGQKSDQSQQGQQGQQAQSGQKGQQQSGSQQSQSGAQKSGSQQSGSEQANSGQQGNQSGQQQGGQSQQQQLAQAVQEAHEAQQQAAETGNPAAAQRAAQALARAQQISQQMSGQSQQNGQQNGQQSGQPGGQQAGKQASGSSQKGGKNNNPNPQSSTGGEQQAQGQPNGQTTDPTGGDLSKVNEGPGKTWGDARPAPVKELGIAPSDWARLPPRLQSDLLNAAQQKGPPEYQQMIKNYYTQIARMQSDGDNR